jgi:hypothetical protein
MPGDITAEIADGERPMTQARGLQPGTLSLVKAVYRGNVAEARALLDSGADVNWRSRDGWPLLHYAVSGGHAEAVRLLLKAGADVNAQTRDGVTPVINAIEWGYAEVVEVLLAHEADLTAQDEYGRTALKMAADLGHSRIVALLQTAKTKEMRVSDIHELTKAGNVYSERKQ